MYDNANDPLSNSSKPENRYESKSLERLVQAHIDEQKRRRRWGIFFKIILILLLVLLYHLIFRIDPNAAKKLTAPHTALISINGEITSNSDEISMADNFASSLKEALDNDKTRGIIIRINSPGGSPVQAAYMYDEIRRQMANHKNVKIYAVCTDVCASAAYYIASAANYIYSSPASLVGSIGVLMDDFGFVDSMQKLGVQRRLLTAGNHKGFLDPFSPLSADDQKIAQAMLDDVHQLFIKSVQQGRGNRLKNDPQLFSGLVWTGSQALPLGLIDGFGSPGYVAREIIKSDNIVDYTVRTSAWDKLASRMGSEFSKAMTSALGLDVRRLK